MKLVDANVLLYAVNTSAERHGTAKQWLDDALSGNETVGFAWVVVLAFLRIATHRAVFPRPLEAAEALGVVRDWLAQPTAIVLEPTARHVDLLTEMLSTVGTAGNLVSDAHLAALAIEHGGDVISFDADFSRFAGVHWQLPSAG
jgi:toxin-antitoxin system PIN domain toxin